LSTRSAGKPASGGLVYSTDSGRMCPGCRRPQADCVCAALAKPAPASDGTVRVGCETKGRGGKAVTTVRGLDLAPDALAALGKTLRAACGAGGAVKDGALEIQGDHRDRVMAALQALGLRVKRSGG
jgi:translation initiation factor 1